MHYSLESRFLGALAGMTLGANLAENGTLQSRQDWEWLYLSRHWLNELIETGLLPPNAVLGNQQDSPLRSSTLTVQPNPASMALSALPLMLCYFDAPQQWQTQLQAIASNVAGPDPLSAELLIVGHSLALVLRESFNFQASIQSHFQSSSTSPLLKDILTSHPIQEQLEWVDHLITQGTSSAMAWDSLERRFGDELARIALAFYYLGSSPSHFHLSVLRAVQCPNEPVLVTALVGAIAGAHHSYYGIPTPWRLWGQQHDSTLLRQGKQLFLRWTGVSGMVNLEEANLSEGGGAIAVAGTIQPRQSFSLISQSPD